MGLHDTPLPSVLEPSGTRCVPLFIPDDDDYMTMIVEHIRKLTNNRRYERGNPDDIRKVQDTWLNVTYAPFLNSVVQGLDCSSQGFPNEVDDCIVYPLYAPFIEYIPYNPYNGDPVPSGYASDPFTIYDGSGSLPPAYQQGDLIVPFGAITLQDFTVFGQSISIKIDVVGSGQVEIDLLSIVQGGVAVLKVGENPPNAIDIVNGIIGTDIKIIDLEQDVTSAPPEQDVIVAEEVNIVATNPTDVTTIWISFLPVVDDSFIPLRFGGGIRSIQLCSFESMASDMGVTDIRLNAGNIEYFQNGVWTVVGAVLEDCNDVENCLVSSPTIATINSDIASNTSSIASNTSAINANIADIAQNTADIADLRADVDLNQSVIETIKGTVLNNTYDPAPTQATDETALCGSSWYVAEQLVAIAQNAENNKGTVNLFTAIVNFLTGGSGWVISAVDAFYNFIYGNTNPSLATEIGNATQYVAEHFFCNDLNVILAQADILADTNISSDARDAISLVISMVETSKFNEWIATGSLDDTRNCSSFPCFSGQWTHTIDFTVGQGGLQPIDPALYNEQWVSGQGWQALGNNSEPLNKDLVMELRFSQPVNILEWRSDWNWGVLEVNRGASFFLELENSGSFTEYGYTVPSQTGPGFQAGSNDVIVDAVGWWYRQSISDNFYLTSLTLTGVGYNPFA